MVATSSGRLGVAVRPGREREEVVDMVAVLLGWLKGFVKSADVGG